ncbi:type II toxin-antitoxin system YafQ family toxin [Levilactobacillus fuyuanensis]|uniref:Type II toxin-antitoxin system YafQ family toxin n=1 Tax=Levilactobacillus fuyuanensis TaxID=2486022 RepID=A0ABW4H4K9_9LACO|nr:type II toxin-antitoxin system YafQ family toxin [Levilactobacillus fuyuanensis]
MKKLKFKPRMTFTADLKRLAKLDNTIIDEVRAAIDLLLETHSLPEEFRDHALTRRWAGYREFHLRDTLTGQQPADHNDVLVVYAIDEDALILIGLRVGSHDRLFSEQDSSVKFHRPQQ